MKLLFFLSFILIQFCIHAQLSYSNDSGDTVTLSGDTVTLKLSNHDAFRTFGISKKLGLFKGGKFCFEKSSMEFSSTMKVKKSYESGVIKFSTFGYSGEPLVYVNVSCHDIKSGEFLFRGVTDENGVLVLNENEANEIHSKLVRIVFETVGFYGEMDEVLTLATHYSVANIIDFPFLLIRKKNQPRLKVIDDSSIVVKYQGKLRTLNRD